MSRAGFIASSGRCWRHPALWLTLLFVAVAWLLDGIAHSLYLGRFDARSWLLATDFAVGDEFGLSVSISGDTAMGA